MKIAAFLGASFAALCVFLALLASPIGAEVVTSPPIVASSTGDPTPRAKPDRNRVLTLPDGIRIARQCPASTIMSKVVDDKGTRAFYARYSGTAFNEMLGAGCTVIQQGCNTCRVQYTGCTDQQRAACTDGECLARVCKRRMVCTSKSCSAYGDVTPSCDARFARQACLASAFDPLDSAAPSRE